MAKEFLRTLGRRMEVQTGDRPIRRKETISRFLGIALVGLLIGSMFGASPSIANAAGKFDIGDTVEVYNTGGAGLYVRDAPCGNVIGGKFDGDRGVVLNGPVYCQGYNRWLIRWSDALEGWSAEDWLREIPTEPDLTVTSVNAPTSAELGGYIAVSWTVKNQGDAPSGSFYNRISLATTPYGTDISLGNFPMGSIAPGSSSSDAQVPKIPESVSPGYYYVTVYTDSLSAIAESDEYNNINKAPSQIHITKVEYTLAINISGQGITNPSPGTHIYDKGTQVTITASPASGWGFDHWGGGASGTSTSVTITMNSNKSVTAYFKKITVYYNLSTSISPSGSGSISPSSGSYEEGTVVTLTATPYSGYIFDHWSGTNNNYANPTTVTMNSNKSVIAYFKKPATPPDLMVTSVSAPSSAKVGDTISVTFTVKNQGGSSSGSFSNRVSLATSAYGTTYSLGNFSMSSLGAGASQTKTVSVTIPSVSSGYYYVTVFTDGFQAISESDENNNIGSTYPSKVHIGKTYTLTTSVSPSGSGSISPSSGSYEEGIVVTLTATPYSGYIFDHWSGTNNNYANPTTVTMNSSKSVTAYFVVKPAPDIHTPIGSVDFGDVTLGSSLDNTTTIYNDGNATLTINSITRASGSSDFTYIGPSTPFNIGPGGSQVITIRFTPSSQGTKSGIFNVNSNDPDEANVSFSVSGSGTGAPEHDVAILSISTDPSSPYAGQSTTIYVTVKNEGNEQESNVPVKVYADGSQVGSTQYVTFPAGQTTTKSFSWTPSTAKTYSVTGEVEIVIGETDTADNSKTISVSVSSVPTPDIRTPIGSVDFGDVTINESLDKTIIIHNDGNTTLTINSINRTSGSSDFTYINPSIPFNIEAGGSQAITIRFAPTSAASKSATFTVNSNDPHEANVTFNVSGSGTETVAPTVSTNDASNVSSTSAILNGYLDNTGGLDCLVWFEYGKTTSYGRPTTKVSKSSPGSFSASISGLSLDTTYYFRAVASNSRGTSYGSDVTFIPREISIRIDGHSANPREVKVGEASTLRLSFTNTGNTSWTFYAAVSLRKPDGQVINLPLKVVTLDPWQQGSAQWTYRMDMEGNWDVVFGVWKEQEQVNSLGHTGWLIDYITGIPPTRIYELTISVSGQGTTNPSPGTHTYNESTQVTVTATPASGWSFDHWRGDVSGSQNPVTIMMNSDKGVTAYFTTATLAQLIEQETMDRTPVTIDGQQYFIVTLKRRIDVNSLEIVPGSGATKVYVDVQGTPVSDRGLAQKIGVIDESRRWVEGVGSASNISQHIDAMRSRWTIHRQIKWLGFSLELLPATAAISVRAYFTGGASIPKDTLSAASKMFLAHASNPGWVLENVALANFSEAEEEYRKAMELAGSTGGISDDETASAYFKHLFNAYANDYSARQLLDQIDEIDRKTLGELAELGVRFSAGLVGANYGLFESLVDSLRALPLTSSYFSTWDQWHSNYEKIVSEPNYHARYTLSLAWRDPTLTKGVASEKLWTITKVGSPVELRVYDSQGRVTGMVNGEARSEIPNSSYYDNTVTMLFPSDSYSHEVAGISEGAYDLEVATVAEETSTFTLINVPTSASTVHQYSIDWDALAKGEKGITMKIDSDGDGTFERVIHLSGVEEGKRGLPTWAWVTIGVVVALIVAFVIRPRIARKQDAKA